MPVDIAPGLNQTTLYEIPFEIFSELRFERRTVGTGLVENFGPGVATLQSEVLSIDEIQYVLNTLGLNSFKVSDFCTVELRDMHQIPLTFNGVMEIFIERKSDGLIQIPRIELTQLERIV